MKEESRKRGRPFKPPQQPTQLQRPRVTPCEELTE